MPPSKGRSGNLRADLLDSTAALLRSRGLGFVSLRAVARRSRVSHGAPAHHFKNKAGLITAFAAESYQRLVAITDRVIARAGGDGRDRLEAVGCAYVRFALDNPERFALMFRTELLDESDRALRDARDTAMSRLVDVIALCSSQGYLRGRNVETVAAAAWSLTHGLAQLWLAGRLPARINERDAHRVTREVTRLFVRAIMPDSKR